MRYITELIDETTFTEVIKKSKSYVEASKILKISDGSIRKLIRIYNVNVDHFPKRGQIKNDLTGKKFGLLLVLARADGRGKRKRTSWKCLCDCGITLNVVGESLVSGHTQSCGCLQIAFAKKIILKAIENNTIYDPKIGSAKIRYSSNYADGNLSFDEFLSLSQMICHYCGCLPSNSYNPFKSYPKTYSQFRIKNGTFIYNGLDRINSDKPHDKDNVVPCCHPCNFAKNDFTIEFFKNHVQSILNFRLTKFEENFSVEKLISSLPTLTMSPIVPYFLPVVIPYSIEVKNGAVFGRLTVLEVLDSKKCLCRCECGTEKNVLSVCLYRGTTRSCGNTNCNSKFSPLIATARNAWGISYNDLPFEKFFELSQMNCSYCGALPSNRRSSVRDSLPQHDFIYNGLDRLDSSKGHTIDNVVPCCITCNKMKLARSLSDFDQWLTNINNHWLNRSKY